MSEIKALRGLSILQHDFCLSDQCIERMDRLSDEIQAEVERDYMRLPVDAEGVPIHVGDRLKGVFETFEVCAVSEHYAYWAEGRHWDKASECRHVKPRTVEDVLHDFGWECVNNCGADPNDIASCADEIRELLGGAE